LGSTVPLLWSRGGASAVTWSREVCWR
jgi:hypothetical protein